MKQKKLKLFFTMLYFLIFSSFYTIAETFSADSFVPLEIKADGTPATVSISLNEAVSIKIPEDTTYIQGIELTVKVPRDSYGTSNSINWALFECAFTEENNSFSFSDEKNSSGSFGNMMTLSIKIPFVSANTIKKDPYSIVINKIPDVYRNQLYLCINSSSQEQNKILKAEITGKPIFINKGELQLNIINNERRTISAGCNIFIDGKSVNLQDKYFLTVGNHSITIQNEDYRNETRDFTIERAKSTFLEIQLTDISPMIRISAPAGTEIYMDGNEILSAWEYFKVTEGCHVFKMTIGDCEIVKTLNAMNGRNYTITVTLDANISEDE